VTPPASGSAAEGPLTDTPVRARLAADLLAWGQPRPAIPPGLVDDLRDRLEALVREMVVTSSPSPGHGSAPPQPIRITPAVLDRQLDGGARPSGPFEHTRANVRGVLAQAVVERDLLDGHRGRPDEVVAAVWMGEASRAAGDPASRSAWLNRQPRAEADDLRAELTDLLAGFREIWPRPPRERIEVRPSRQVTLGLAGGRVLVAGRVGPVLDSLRQDERARALLLDLCTARPRPPQDRRRRRHLALLETLDRGRPPFRWASLHLTDLRVEPEDLDEAALVAGVEAVGAALRGLVAE
jgi:hypothetical protein